MPIATTASEVLALFSSSSAATTAYQHWSDDASRVGVRAVVQGHVSAAVYNVTVNDLGKLKLRILDDSDDRFPRGRPANLLDEEALHPLTAIKKEAVKGVLNARDWNPPLAFNHAFHYLIEKRGGKLFTYPEFRAACKEDSVLYELLYKSEEDLLGSVHGDESRAFTLECAMRWRLGCAYYAFLKELWILSWSAKWEIPLRVHPLADTLFRTDFWTPGGEQAFAMYIRNRFYQDALDSDVGITRGRKNPMADYASAVFAKLGRIQIDTPTHFGTVEYPNAAQIKTYFTSA